MDLISIIVPVYKVEPYLDRCIQSIVDQTYTNLEIILVDDGSPDRCPQMCDEWAKRDQRIRVIHKENGGLSDARNAGMQIARGEYIAFVDSDDWLEPMFAQNLLNAILDHECEVSGCEYRQCFGEETTDHAAQQVSAEVLDRTSAMSALIDEARIKQVVWNKLYKKSVIDGILFEKGKYHEDEFWTYQIVGRLKRYVATAYSGYNYVQRMDSIMGKTYSIKRLDAVEAKVRRQAYLEENMQELAGKSRVNLVFTCVYHGQMVLKHLKYDERDAALSYLKKTCKAWKLSDEQKKTLKFTHRIWADLAECSLITACRIRNALKIGL